MIYIIMNTIVLPIQFYFVCFLCPLKMILYLNPVCLFVRASEKYRIYLNMLQISCYPEAMMMPTYQCLLCIQEHRNWHPGSRPMVLPSQYLVSDSGKKYFRRNFFLMLGIWLSDGLKEGMLISFIFFLVSNVTVDI